MKYIKTTILYSLILLLCSCINDKKEKRPEDKGLEVTDDTTIKPDTLSNIPWTAVLDTNTQAFSMKRDEKIVSQPLDSSNVLKALNKDYPSHPIVWNRRSGDTAYVSIPNSTILTQQSGTLGAKVFLAESTYSITEIPGINVVNFNFTVGDHASPGAYKRSDFNFSVP